MRNQFGKCLRTLIEKHEVKEQALADAINYNVTYISKWLNGAKLPSEKNVDRIISGISAFLNDKNCVSVLKRAYSFDRQRESLKNLKDKQLALAKGSTDIKDILKKVLMRTVDDGIISIHAGLDFFRLMENDMDEIYAILTDPGIKKTEIHLTLDKDELKGDYVFYCKCILSAIARLDFVEISISEKLPEIPPFITINEDFSAQLLFQCGGTPIACYGFEEELMELYRPIISHHFTPGRGLLDPALPQDLRKTNVQLDSYSDDNQWLFFNEAPAMLFPDELADYLIKTADNASDSEYLTKLMNIFRTRTVFSNVHLTLYSSVMNDYVKNGRLSIGNVPRHFSRKQVQDHIRYLQKVMRDNRNFHIYLIRDTVVRDESFITNPSLFIDNHSISIENSRLKPNKNYHISMDPTIREMFLHYYEWMLHQPSCMKLDPHDLDRFL